MAAQKMLLFSDRISHPARACLLLLKRTGLPYEEKKLDMFKGDHLRTKELPMKKLPVLIDNGFVLAESTSILRYIALKSGDDTLYPADIQARTKVDECLDFWQSSLNANVLALVQNKLMWKLMLRKSEPDVKRVKEVTKLHTTNKKTFNSYFLAGKPFVGGETASIADLLVAVTLEQSTVAGSDNSAEEGFISRVKHEFKEYDAVHEDVNGLIARLEKMKML
jgi:glutathione S-transferase